MSPKIPANDGANVPFAPSRQDFHLRWAGLGAPQRPPSEVVEAMRPLLKASRAALQLGVTPEIAGLSAAGIAVDWDAAMIRDIWLGDSETHRAVLGNWLALPLKDGSVDAVFGDGCISVMGWPVECQAMLQELARVLRPGGRLVLRCFAGPDAADPMDRLTAAALAGEIPSFGEFKLRFNMAAFQVSEGDNTGDHIYRLFRAKFPDLARLAAATGWSPAEIGSMEAYAGSPSIYSYPTRKQIGRLLREPFRHYFSETTGYPLAERCPLLVADMDAA